MIMLLAKSKKIWLSGNVLGRTGWIARWKMNWVGRQKMG